MTTNKDGSGPAGRDSIRWQRDIPLRYKADVAVIGGGIAGVCAACAAAAEGASVIVVERFAVTGGNATVGGVANWAGETRGQGAIFDEILAKQETWNSVEPYPGPYEHYSPTSRRVFDHGVLATILQEMLLGYGVKLLLHTRFVDVQRCGRRVGPALVAGASGLEGMQATVFIDASGGAELAKAGGCTMLPDGPYGPLPASIEYFVREMTAPAKPQLPPGWFTPVTRREDLPMTSPWPNGPNSVALKVKVVGRHSGDTEGLTALEISARRRPDDERRTYLLSKEDQAVPPYHIPFRPLVARDADNLLMAGRCMSADQLALSSARTMTTCAMMGQAAGTAAAWSVVRQVGPRDLDGTELRARLEERGADLSLAGRGVE